MLEGNERNIYTEKFDLVSQHIRRHMANVGAFHIDYTLVAAKRPCQLAISHIYGIHLDGTVLQHAIGKAAGRSTNIHANLAVGGHGENLHCFFQLQAAAAYIADIMPAHFHRGILGDHFTGLVGLLIVYKNNAGHNQRFCTLTALHQSILAQILIQSNFHLFSSLIACTRPAASNPKTFFSCGTVA